MWIFLLNFLFLIYPLYSEEPITLKIQEKESLSQGVGKRVQVRGFLSIQKEGVKVLSDEPNLRTCCVGTKNKQEKQILVVGKVENISSASVVTLRGDLSFNKIDGEPLYKLENIERVQGF